MRVLMLCLLVIAATAQTHAENWPQWRGPSGSAVSTERNLPERWDGTSGIAWTAPLRVRGISTPVVWGDRVFITSQVGAGALREGNHPTLVQGGTAQDAGERALGLDEETRDAKVLFLVEAFRRGDGGLLWTFELPAEGELPGVHEKHNLASASPVTDGERVYAIFGTGQMVAVDMSGKRAWQRNLAEEYGAFQISWGHGSSPIVYKDLVILPCYHEPASYLLALDRRTGETRWRVERESEVLSYSTPLLVESASGDELVLNSSQGIEAYDPSTGKALWHMDEPNRFPIPTPVHHDDVIYASRGYRSGPYAAIRTGGRGDIAASHVLWNVPTGAPYIASLVYYDGLLYMAGDVGVVTCIDAKTGERVWQERIDGIFTASPVAGDGKIYLVSETGETIVMRAGRTPDLLARNPIDGRLLASPAISGGWLFLRTDDSLVAVSGQAMG
ncbi:MAG: PQQ-binding-like beta-propeller repeat protein [Luteitalea sp.]|nr:PQQ-binding-like beta-propeller repeat protein [Luteitalea sp.]